MVAADVNDFDGCTAIDDFAVGHDIDEAVTESGFAAGRQLRGRRAALTEQVLEIGQGFAATDRFGFDSFGRRKHHVAEQA